MNCNYDENIIKCGVFWSNNNNKLRTIMCTATFTWAKRLTGITPLYKYAYICLIVQPYSDTNICIHKYINTFSDFVQYHNLRACFFFLFILCFMFILCFAFFFSSTLQSGLEDQCQLIWYYAEYGGSSYVHTEHLYTAHIV